MSKRVEDGNYQDMSVHAKDVAALGPTEEAQDMTLLNRVVVPMPAFTDPNDPAKAAGSINLSLDAHPAEHAEDYGAGVEPGEHQVESPMDAAGDPEGHTRRARAGSAPDDRAEWSKQNWKDRASELGLPVSGNAGELERRVSDREEEIEAAGELQAADWIDQVKAASDKNELDSLKSLYDASGAEYSTVEDAFDAKQNELGNNDS